jgi:putative flippase GtrA
MTRASLASLGHGQRLVRFLAVGVLNTAVGYAIYALLVLAGLSPQPALALAFALGVLWNYATHARLVFGTEGYRRLPAYAAAYAVIYAVNAFSLARALAYGFHPLVAQAVLAVVMAGLSFVLLSAVLTGEIPFLRRKADRAGKG